MGLAFADNAGFNVHDAVFPFAHLFDSNCYPVGNLIIQKAKRFFSDKLCRNLAHGLIRNCVLIIKHGAAGQIFKKKLQQKIGIFFLQCGKRHNFCKLAHILVGVYKC